MARRKWTAESLNEEILKIQKAGWIPITEQERIQQSFATLVIPSNLKRGGQIRTFEEVNAFIRKKQGENAITLTQEEYTKEINKLANTVKYNTLRGLKTHNREVAIKQLEEYRDEFENTPFGDIDFNNYSADELKEVFNWAHNTITDNKWNSLKFYDLIYDYFVFKEAGWDDPKSMAIQESDLTKEDLPF